MAHPIAVRNAGRTAVVGGWVVVLAVAGRPAWLALLLGLVLVSVWASPLLSASTRRGVLPVAGPELAGPEPAAPELAVEPGEAASG